jgi:toxin ParE1/3/4
MAYSIIVSKDADNDIDDIVKYIITDLRNPIAANSFLIDIEKSYNAVISNPYMYSIFKDTRLIIKGYRKIVIKNYLLIYRIDENDKRVVIVRVIYGGRDYHEIL